MKFSRREFLIYSGAAFPLCAMGAAVGHDSRIPWFQKMRRCAQHNLNEHDPQTLDIDAWLEYWASLKLDALVLTAGGLMAFYPTKIRFHHQSQFLGARDLFGDYLKAAKKRNIRIVARIETNWLHKELLDQRPEWVQRDERGNPIYQA